MSTSHSSTRPLVRFSSHGECQGWCATHWQTDSALDQATEILTDFIRQRDLLPQAERVAYEMMVRSCAWQLPDGSELPGNDQLVSLRWLDSEELARAMCVRQSGSVAPAPLRLSITALTPEIARILATYPGDLELAGITRLDSQTARALAERPAGRLRLTLGLGPDGIADFTGLGSLWSRRDANLCLPAMTRLDDEAAELLGRTQGTLSLPKLTRLSKRQAEWLVRGNLVRLELGGLGDAALTEEIASALCSGKINELALPLLSHSAPSLGLIASHPWGMLQLDGLRQLPQALAAILCRSSIRSLKLNGLASLDLNTARALCGDKRPFHLSLHGLASLEDSVVGVLVSNEFRELDIPGVTQFSQVARQMLIEFGNFKCPAIGH